MEGTILKGIGGFYYVADRSGTVYECRARGIFRKEGLTPLAGDRVRFAPTSHTLSPGEYPKARIEKILPRLNSFERPPCANVETLVLVCAAKDPAPSFGLIDRYMASASRCGAKLIICISKEDLAEEEVCEEFRSRYEGIYPLFFVNGISGEGIEALLVAIKGSRTALAGVSGVGKSSIANLLIEEEDIETGRISEKTSRGRHTTRHTELFRGDGFFLFDTPGFSAFDLPDIPPEELAACFPEFLPYLHGCRFGDCTHISEPGCALRHAVGEGKINKNRYLSFKEMYLELKSKDNY
ncbi:MAG TPA: ribosome small subunit-dependent GTPase A [Bacillota bacterium]|nr:ribosome small subunit-dependent GTPase A [Bacillota bacterium]HQC36120.1 ribosome small subunit-dependent GTPase A [Bacillota bacterium]